ncbi:amino acid ABC transporter substrate-binding protein, PAAT family (TC 3.A.1.3.-)/amino acid ABC transporter membrane protein, PAAT family (TC 3.A.1.3.-) [Aerococcus urinaehominis]|nr:ABC transporter substrate-binding protein/permease [Aerococcus urinaehominis]SDM24068.1 amino acid ABC transporter substrate-binding protein, PAAT family (TC 3.A.1.3.-)/amino acid ABC transporter membrane protein, PAAT family (TC 3.A.1.3.-) [Aerococcus urinaehominis]
MSLFKRTFSILILACLCLGQLALSNPSVHAQTSQQDPAHNALQEIKDRGVLRVGTTSGYPPYEFTILEDGQNKVVGLDVSLSQAIADKLGVELEVIDMDFDSLIPALETGTIDIAAAGLTATEEREKSGDFSIPYVVEDQSFVIRQQDQETITDYHAFDNGQLTLGVYAGTIQENFAKDHIKNVQLTSMKSFTDLISALQAGQVDGVLMDEIVAGAYAAQQDDLTTVASQLDVGESGKSFLIANNQADLLAAIDQTIEEALATDQVDNWIQDAYDLIEAEQGDSWLAYWPYFWDGIKMTLLISLVAMLAGIILGSLLALMRLSDFPWLQLPATIYVEFIRGTPLMVQVLFAFLGLGAIFNLSALTAGLIAVSLNSAAYICEVIRGGINAVDSGQTEAARSLGLGYWPTMQKVVFPQSLRAIWPALGNEFISLIKETSIVSTIGIAELTFQTRAVTSLTYQGLVPLTISMLIYFIMTFSLSKFLGHIEGKMNQRY